MKKFEKEIEIQILASDFKDTKFKNCINCPVSRAIRRTLEIGIQDNVFELIDIVIIGQTIYNGCRFKHDEFIEYQYYKVRKKAIAANYDNTVVHTFKLYANE